MDLTDAGERKPSDEKIRELNDKYISEFGCELSAEEFTLQVH